MEQQSISHAPPVHRLDRHALESIFKFCALKDLHAILSVSREWSNAVLSMPPVGAAILGMYDPARLLLIVASRLSRHVNEIQGACASWLDGLRVIAEGMPWIQRYDFSWRWRHDCDESEAMLLSRLSRLRTLTVALDSFEPVEQHATGNSQLIKAVACLPQLEELTMRIFGHDERILFAPLITLTQLRRFEMHASNGFSALPSEEQVASLRAMTSLEEFNHNFSDRNGTLRLLLHAPIPSLRWTKALVSSDASDDVVVPLLRLLPALRELDVQLQCADVGCLTSFPQLSALTLSWSPAADLSTDQLGPVLPTLQRCPQLTHLCVDSLDFSAEQLGALLPTLPRLSELRLHFLPELTSLRFLATPTLAESLTSLCVTQCAQLPKSEVSHLRGLRSLRNLNVDTFKEPFTAVEWTQLRAMHPRTNAEFW